MLPKGLQNRCWRGHGGHLGALADKGLIQDVIFDDLGSLLGPLWDHFWGSFLEYLFGDFLKWSLGPVFDRFGTPKHLQKETQKGAETET